MADRTSAGIFGYMFENLASDPTDKNKEIASKIFDKSCDYDFSNYQMCADESLIKLNLAKKRSEGEKIIYKGDDGWD